jgi:hypothetical protein
MVIYSRQKGGTIMADDVKLSTFPSSVEEAIAMLYLKEQDLTGKTPVEIYNMYWDAYYEISKDYREKVNSKWFIQQREVIYKRQSSQK